MDAPTMLLPIKLSPEGIAHARQEIDEMEAIVGNATGVAGAKAVSGRRSIGALQPDVVTVYEHARNVPSSHTPKLLELFAREDPLTPEEIGIALGNGKPFSKAQGRAFVRNLSRMEGHLVKQGTISRRVLSKHFGRYEQEGAGRYGLSKQDRAALRRHLGI